MNQMMNLMPDASAQSTSLEKPLALQVDVEQGLNSVTSGHILKISGVVAVSAQARALGRQTARWVVLAEASDESAVEAASDDLVETVQARLAWLDEALPVTRAEIEACNQIYLRRSTLPSEDDPLIEDLD